jgi:hypothetical protein
VVFTNFALLPIRLFFDYWLSCYDFHTYPFFSIADRLSLIRQERAEAAKKREEEKAGTYTSLLLLITCLAFLDMFLLEA